VHRGSTVVFDRLADAVDDWQQTERYTYGLYGARLPGVLPCRVARAPPLERVRPHRRTGQGPARGLRRADWSAARTARFVDALRLFRIGFGWGGVTSLVMAYPDSARLGPRRERLVRLNVGLEEPGDLIEDLRRALEQA